MTFEEIEDVDGVRMTWNVLPCTRIEATRLVVPIATLYTPLKSSLLVPYEPVSCRCKGILSPFAQVDLRARVWVCPFCLSRNNFPNHYHDVSPSNLPNELVSSSIEYILNKPIALPLVFLFLIDVCIDDEDLVALKSSLIVSLAHLPQNALVGLVTYGAMVHVHELAYGDCPKSFVFKGSKDYSPKHVQEMLGLNAPVSRPNAQPQAGNLGAARYL